MSAIICTLVLAGSFASIIANERRVMRKQVAEAREAGHFAGTKETMLRAARRRPIVGKGLSALISRK